MKTAKLNYPVHTLDNRLILPSGKELTKEVLDELVAANKGTAYPKFSLLEHGTIYKDLLTIFQNPPYNTIFEEVNKSITATIMKKIGFIQPALKFLDHFKQNDFYTYRHSLVVFALSISLARDLLEKSEEWILAFMAGTMHDFGKICVPLSVLQKNEPLTGADKKALEHHALAGFVLLSYFLQDNQSFAARVAKEHHERRDGSGYPLGISLQDRMIEIIAVSDVYDALLSPRPYRPTPYNNRTALEEITEMADKGKLSWEVVQALVAQNRKDRPHFRECKVSAEKRGIPPGDNLYGVIKEQKMICPNCHGSSIKEKTHEKGGEYISYECLSCGKEFDKDDLLNLEMEKY